MKRAIIVTSISLLVLGGLTFAFWEEIQIKYIKHISTKTFSNVEKIDRVEIHLIMGDETTEPIGDFLIGPYDTRESVYKIEELQGEELKEFLGIWKSPKVNHKYQSLCHYAGYGFKFFRGDKLVRETSLCWFCSNYSFKHMGGFSWGGFESDSPEGERLLKFCDALIPYDRTFENEMKRRQEEHKKKMAEWERQRKAE